MKAQLALVQVFKDPQGHPPHGPLGYPGKDGIPQLIEQGGAKAQGAVGHHQYHRNPQQHVRAAVLVQVIHDVFQGDRCGYRGQLGHHQQRQRQCYPAPELGQVGPEPGNHFPVGFVVGGVVVISVGAHGISCSVGKEQIVPDSSYTVGIHRVPEQHQIFRLRYLHDFG